MVIITAKKGDKLALIEYFKHYSNDNFIKKRVECYLEHNSTIIAKENNKIIGMLQWYVKENPNSGVAEFEEVFVNKEERGKGIATKLVQKAIKEVNLFFKKNNIKPRKIFLFVSKNNKSARRLYESNGFKFIAELNNLFSEDNELFYCLNL